MKAGDAERTKNLKYEEDYEESCYEFVSGNCGNNLLAT